MELLRFYGCVLLIGFRSAGAYSREKLKCEICKAAAAEVNKLVSGVSLTLTADVGSYRLDERGNQNTKTVPLASSEAYLLDAMDHACSEMQYYARGYDKKTQELRVVRMRVGDQVAADFTEVYPISDADLNDSLKFYCEALVDDHEESFLKVFRKPGGSRKVDELCVDEIGICRQAKETKPEL